MTEYSREEIEALAKVYDDVGALAAAAKNEEKRRNAAFMAAAFRAYAAGLGAEPAGWLAISRDAKSGARILLLWKPLGGLPEHVELGRWSDSARSWVNTYGHLFGGEPDAWAPLVPFAAPQPAPVEAVPLDVSELVIAAREVMEDPADEGRLRALDRALDRFAARVPYAYEPDVDGEPFSTPQPASQIGEADHG